MHTEHIVLAFERSEKNELNRQQHHCSANLFPAQVFACMLSYSLRYKQKVPRRSWEIESLCSNFLHPEPQLSGITIVDHFYPLKLVIKSRNSCRKPIAVVHRLYCIPFFVPMLLASLPHPSFALRCRY
mmetsp:Transcript_34191/g.47600  ORF Transcript_34191/g.47600 Transcript_34191/m.47600 type:complete len:128 (-) Transcript_34191:725-1108(-)